MTAASWDLEPHTAAKLQILGAYLRAWFPILIQSPKFDRIIYIDGFAGPGRYKQGEDGSPIIALKAALGAFNGATNKTFEFHFVERMRRPAASLKANIAHLRDGEKIPDNFQIHVHSEKPFEQAYKESIRAHLQANTGAPAFAFVDPFGWTGIPIAILSELTKRRSTEILVNFMFDHINRFLVHSDQGSNFDGLFGCSEWREVFALTGAERKRFVHDLYRDQLRQTAGAKYVRSFEMRNWRNATDYFLYFASNNQLGLAKMKEAMWKVDRGGDFMFSDATNFDQTVLFQPEPDRRSLRKLIAERFAGIRANVKQVEEFVVEHTPFLATHYRKVLAAMEAEGDMTPIRVPHGRRTGTYADLRSVFEFK